jgi:SAM-dependent methyltransferase
MSVSEHYTRDFYERLRKGATRSAEVIVPLVLRLLNVRSVVDVGCGDGSWLGVFSKFGVEDVLGLDGEYVDRGMLQIRADHFRAADLREPLVLARVFDLAISLEVAEHLPPECAPTLVESLTRLAPAVLFSAAIPFQGGDNHLNEQWLDKWASLFKERDYVAIDCIRRRVWQNDSVEWWYAQNTLLFARASLLEDNQELRAELERTDINSLSLVHPKQYLYLHEYCLRAEARAQRPPALPSGTIEASRILIICLRNAVTSRLRWLADYGRRPKEKPPISELQ